MRHTQDDKHHEQWYQYIILWEIGFA